MIVVKLKIDWSEGNFSIFYVKECPTLSDYYVPVAGSYDNVEMVGVMPDRYPKVVLTKESEFGLRSIKDGLLKPRRMEFVVYGNNTKEIIGKVIVKDPEIFKAQDECAIYIHGLSGFETLKREEAVPWQ